MKTKVSFVLKFRHGLVSGLLALGGISLIATSGLAQPTNTIVATIPLSSYPMGIVVSPDGQFVYVGEYGSNLIQVISTATNTIAATITLDEIGPSSLAISPDGTTLYAANYSDGRVWVISTASQAVVTELMVPSPSDNLTVSPHGKFVYINTSQGDKRGFDFNY
jgi:YVTN family beta-propeller protein